MQCIYIWNLKTPDKRGFKFWCKGKWSRFWRGWLSPTGTILPHTCGLLTPAPPPTSPPTPPPPAPTPPPPTTPPNLDRCSLSPWGGAGRKPGDVVFRGRLLERILIFASSILIMIIEPFDHFHHGGHHQDHLKPSWPPSTILRVLANCRRNSSFSFSVVVCEEFRLDNKLYD